MTQPGLKTDYSDLRQDLSDLCENAAREPEEVRVVAVTKGFGPGMVRRAHRAGYRRIGENRVREALDKKAELDDSLVGELEWHFIGHLQSNKVRHVIGEFDLVHSVDRESLVTEFDKRLSRRGMTQDVLLQVNTSGEESKHGVPPARAPHLLEMVLDTGPLEVRGLMTMAPWTENESVLHETFRACRELRDQLEGEFSVDLPEFSMGMTNDYPIAVQEGATLLRLGRHIFGDRPGNGN